ncbi:MAG TPA: CRISPR-associated protein Cas4 [Anaerolineae bacterium]|nr:CRISPR-associated protein Cas4 [Anaerolineae bacterium]HPL28801.1 CRISPR-associated protein Cas4 [Anaerolineae bacterium]
MDEHGEPDYLPISMLNQLEYCERRFWLMYVCAEMEVNAPVLEGTLQHERVHSGGREQEGEAVTRRRVYLWSDRLRLAGFADLVEEVAGALRPVEHKHGRIGRWLNDQVQLCAQALCLEERTGRAVERGEIFYWGSRRRLEVTFTPELRARTEAAAARAFALLAAGRMPAPLTLRAKCRECSLEGICLPRETAFLEGTGEGVRDE